MKKHKGKPTKIKTSEQTYPFKDDKDLLRSEKCIHIPSSIGDIFIDDTDIWLQAEKRLDNWSGKR